MELKSPTDLLASPRISGGLLCAVAKTVDDKAASVSWDFDAKSWVFAKGLSIGTVSENGPKVGVAIETLRQKFRKRLGIDLPAVKVSINPQLNRREYQISLRQIIAARGVIEGPMNFLCEGGSRSLSGVVGQNGIHPVTGENGKWVDEDEAIMRRGLGSRCHGGQELVLLHLESVAMSHAPELLTRSEVQILLDHLHEGAKPLVQELIPTVFSLAEFQRVLQGLLAERVSLRDLEKVLEALGEVAIEWPEASRRPVEAVVEKVRIRISRSICASLANSEGEIHCLSLAPEVEQKIYESRLQGIAGSAPEMAPEAHRAIIDSVRSSLGDLESSGVQGVILCSPDLRISIKKLLEKEVPTAAVLSYNEIAHGFTVKSGGIASVDLCSAETPLTGERESTFE